MNKHLLYYLLLILFLTHTFLSFKQHYHAPLDGDMPSLLPDHNMQVVLDHPLGLYAITHHENYVNPNRYFCHWCYQKYFDYVPFILQKSVDPIKSLYLSCAIAKILFQIGLIWLLAVLICGSFNIIKLDFIIAVILVTPLFQTFGFSSICIIDFCVTYAFFYAFPTLLIGLYFLPYIYERIHNKKIHFHSSVKVLWILLALISSLSGSLNPGIALIFGILIFIYEFYSNYYHSKTSGLLKRGLDALIKTPNSFWIFIFPIMLFSLYSLFVGRYNSQSIFSEIPLSEAYSRLPKGIYYAFAGDFAFPILFIVLLINSFFIHFKFPSAEGKKILNLFKWIGIFSIIYIALLPLGGYRPYRPNILRYDTILPITLSLVFMFGISSLFLIKNIQLKQKTWYIPIILVGLLIFTIKNFQRFSFNDCEKSALQQISNSKETIIELNNDCSVVSWGKISKPEDSQSQSAILLKWHIIDRKKLFYSK